MNRRRLPALILRFECAGLRQRIGIGTWASGQRICREESGKTARCAAAEGDWKERSLKGKLVDGSHIFPYIVDAVSGANRSAVVAEKVVGQAESGTDASRIIIIISGAVCVPAQTGKPQILRAAWVHKWELALFGESRIEIADMARAIVKAAEKFRTDAQIQCQILRGFPIILEERAEIIRAVLKIRQATTAKAELGRAEKKILEITITVWRVCEEELTVKYLRENLVKINDRYFAADADHVSALNPTDGINYG